MSIPIGVYIIFLSTLVSSFLARSIDLTSHELGALYNWLWPPFIGVVMILLFCIVCWISKKDHIRIWTLVACCIYTLYVGVALHFEKDNWPLVIWY